MSTDERRAGPATLTSGPSADATMPGAEPSGVRLRDGGHVAGDRVGRYEIVAQIGRGAMGIVYEAHDPDLDRRIALKVIRFPTLTEDGTSEREVRLRREAQALAQLSHPNVVAVLDVGRRQRELFIAMELVRGETLTQWLSAATRSWSEVLDVFVAAGAGLAAAHAVDLVHRDFKPDNVMVGDDGRVRVLDFGVARLGDPGGSMQAPISVGWDPAESTVSTESVTRAGAAPGTPAYMAPEQHKMLDVDARADQFSFCAALYEGLYGLRAFTGTTPVALSASICADPPRPPPADHDVPGWLFRVIRRGLAKEPNDRFGSMDELLGALRPRAKLARWVVGSVAGGIVAAAGAWGFVVLDARADKEACLEAGQAIAASYSPAAAEAIEEAFAATGVPYAETSSRIVTEGLEAYATDWSQARTGICRRATVERSWTADQASRATECLEERRDRLAALVEVLSEGGREMVFAAPGAVAELPDPAPCADAAVIARRAPVVKDPVARRRIAMARRELQRAAALQSSAQYDAALELATGVLDEALAEGPPRLTLEAELVVGEVLGQQDDNEPARKRIEHVYFEAERLGLDEMAFDAAILLVNIVGRNLEDAEEGLQWARHAEGVLGRIVPPDELRQAALLDGRAYLHERKHDLDVALADHRAALEIRRRLLGDEHGLVGASLSGVGSVHFARQEIDETARVLEQVLEISIASYGARHPRTGGVHHNLGVVRAQQRRFEDARRELTTALEIREQVHGEGHSSVASTLEALGDLAMDEGDDDLAYELQGRALVTLEEALGPNHPKVARILNNLSKVTARLGRHEEALEQLQRSLAIVSLNRGAEHPNTLLVRWGVGRQLVRIGRYDKAREHLDEVRRLDEGTAAPSGLTVSRDADYVQLLWDDPAADRRRLAAIGRQALRDMKEHLPADDAWRKEFETWWAEHEAEADVPPPDSAGP